MRAIVALLLVVVAPALASDARTEVAGLRFSVPKGWDQVPTSSPLIVAEFRIPRAGRGEENGDLVLFQFGDEKGRPVSDAFERWYGQFSQPDGRPSREVAVVATRVVNGLRVKTIDISGTYRPILGPMEHHPEPGYRLLGAVIEGPGGPWHWRALGPAKTIAKAKDGFDALVDSCKAAP